MKFCSVDIGFLTLKSFHRFDGSSHCCGVFSWGVEWFKGCGKKVER